MPLKHLEKSERKPVFCSKASYFNPVSRRWQAGNFKLYHSYFEFMTKDAGRNSHAPFHLSFPLATISSIEKRQSSFIFACLVIIIGSETHWFSSFPNRDTVYNLMELFWRDLLLVKHFNVKFSNLTTHSSTNGTSLGKELLSILHESEKTLTDAASALEDQGRQLFDTEETVHNINQDLSAAEKLLKKMSSWPTAGMSNGNKDISRSEEKKKEFVKRKYKVTFSNESNSSNYNDWDKGFLVISDELALLDDKENVKFKCSFLELRAIQVISPWEFSLSQENCNGMVYNIMCPALSRVLKVLAAIPCLQNKVFYGNGDDDSNMENSSSCSSNLSMVSAVSTPSSSTGFLTPEFSHLSDQIQQVQNHSSLTDEELVKISSVLSNLQTLATEVGKEQQSQMEKINTLVTDVQTTELRINVDTKLIRRLT